MPWYAHSLKDRPEAEWETQCEHAARVAAAAALRAGKFGMGPVAEAAGRLHDLGKYTTAFQGHIAGRGRAAEDRDHSSAGAVYARNRLGRPVGALVAHVVAGHHAGLKDALLGEGQRLDRREAALGPVVRTAGADGFPFPGSLPAELAARLGKRSGFALALLTRMLFSCLVDADRTETRAAEDERLARAGLPPAGDDEPPFTATPADLAAELERTTAERDADLRREGRADDPVNRLRTRVRDHVSAQANLPPGVFTLTVPTGGGKTLTSLRFALDHAKANGLDRVLVVIPFTGVRIETTRARATCCGPSSPPRGGADRNSFMSRRRTDLMGRPFAGVRIETLTLAGVVMILRGRPFAGVRIETAQRGGGRQHGRGRPFAGVRIETRWCSRTTRPSRGRPFAGVRIET